MPKDVRSNPFLTLNAPVDLLGQVMEGIWRARLRRLQFRFGLCLSGVLAFLAGICAFRETLLAGIRSSAAFSFLRFAVTDPDIVLSSFKAFAIGFFETVPLVEVLVLCIGLFLLSLLFASLQTLRRLQKELSFTQSALVA